MTSVLRPNDTEQPKRVALYARVSTEDQAERQTVQSQLGFLRQFCALYDLPVASEYVDDGWSGTIPLVGRPEGQRLLTEAKEGRFTEVLVYRLDRLGRSLKALLEAHAELDRTGITIRSATEPFDTSTPIGRFVFQLLGSIAELERETITERTMLGRVRALRDGKWTNGPIPFGYDVDADGRLAPSRRLVQGLDITEAALVRDIFEHIAEGSTLLAEARRLTALGVPVVYRLPGGGERRASKEWRVGRIYDTITNPLYKGAFVMQTRQNGKIECDMPALVDAELWEAANRTMTRNRALSKKNAKGQYLLRGLVVCECGMRYSGVPRTKNGRTYRYYRCNGQLSSLRPTIATRCQSKMIDADEVEGLVWRDIRAWSDDPGESLHDVMRRIQEQAAQASSLEQQQRPLLDQLREKEAERERVLELYRRGHLSMPEVERQLEAVGAETETLHNLLAALDAQAESARVSLEHLADAERIAEIVREQATRAERENDWGIRRQIVEQLVYGIKVTTEGAGRAKLATLEVEYAFARPTSAVVSGAS